MGIANILLVIITSLASGIIGVWISNRHSVKTERNKFKRDVFLQFIANRNDITGDLFTQALNSIIFAFNDDKNTVEKLKEFYDAVSPNSRATNVNDKLLELILAMLENLKMKVKDIDPIIYLRTFNNKLSMLS